MVSCLHVRLSKPVLLVCGILFWLVLLFVREILPHCCLLAVICYILFNSSLFTISLSVGIIISRQPVFRLNFFLFLLFLFSSRKSFLLNAGLHVFCMAVNPGHVSTALSSVFLITCRFNKPFLLASFRKFRKNIWCQSYMWSTFYFLFF